MQHRRRDDIVQEPRRDSVEERLEQVNRRLLKPAFLRGLTPSRLPSQATSDRDSQSPGEPPAGFARLVRRRSPLNVTADIRYHGFSHDEDELTEPFADLTLKEKEQLQTSFLEAWKHWASMASERGFTTFAHGHKDLVLAVDFNFYGNRMVTASSDHRLKVWDKVDDTWTLIDTWGAHDAEIVDVKWNGPFMGEVLGSIGEDGLFKLWQENVAETPKSGRRFTCIAKMKSETKVPFMALDLKNIMTETYIALITRDGYLSVYEPVDHDNLSEWQSLYSRYICPTPSRQEETGFKVCFHKEKLPCYTAIQAGLDRKALSLAVAAMDVVKVFRTDKERRFYIAAELTGSRDIIRDVDWANGAMRGFDLIATASKDGRIRIYELTTPNVASSIGVASCNTSVPFISDIPSLPKIRAAHNAPSGIGAGLAGASRVNDTYQDEDSRNPGRVKHDVKLITEIAQHHGAVWRVCWSPMGDLLVSSGDDGAVRTWKRALNGSWLEAAEVEVSKEG